MLILALIALVLIAVLVVLLVQGTADPALASAILQNVGSCIWGIAGCSGLGAGAMSFRDSMSKGSTTSGAQLVAAKE
jgi:hypothetical protein